MKVNEAADVLFDKTQYPPLLLKRVEQLLDYLEDEGWNLGPVPYNLTFLFDGDYDVCKAWLGNELINRWMTSREDIDSAQIHAIIRNWLFGKLEIERKSGASLTL